MGHLTYFGMLLPWGALVLGLQWALGYDSLRGRLRLVGIATVIPTAYLILADSVALAQGIWTIHDDRIVGLRLGNVPIEEAIFFLITNLMVVQSVVLLSAPEARARLRRLLSRSTAAAETTETRRSLPGGTTDR